MPREVGPPKVILKLNRIHLMIAIKDALPDPGTWKPFPNEANITIRELIDELLESDTNLNELAEKYGYSKPEFFIVDVRLADFQPDRLAGVASKLSDLEVVMDVICEAATLIRSEHDTLRDTVGKQYGKPRYYIVIDNRLSERENRVITGWWFRGYECHKCHDKRELEKELTQLCLTACTMGMDVESGRKRL